MLNLNDRVVIVTGAGRGIGRGIAEKLASLKATVIVNDINSDTCNNVAGEICKRGEQAIAVAGDVTNPSDVSEVVKQTIEKYGRVDILVNNAGIIGLKPFEEITLNEWTHMFHVHLTGSFLFSQAVLPYMKKSQKGKIINIASNWGQRGAAGSVHYSAVKAGVIGFTKALAREFAEFNILVNAVAPGPIETEMIEEEARLLNTSVENIRNQLTKTIPLNRLGSINDVATTIAFLASEAGDYYCGQILSPNGGEVM